MKERILNLLSLCMDAQAAGHDISFNSDNLGVDVVRYAKSPISIVRRITITYDIPNTDAQISEAENYVKELIGGVA